MNLAQQYERQYAWRSWRQAYDALQPVDGTSLLDLGCAIGDQSRDLAGRGARILGIDADGQLVAHAQSRGIAHATFKVGDIRHPQVGASFDGLWASFVPAYFPDLAPVLSAWRELLKPGGWIALTEVDGMFDHEPLTAGARALLASYGSEAAAAGRYDFDMGRKLSAHLSAAGFQVEKELILPDRELSFAGAASPEVLEAWSGRLARMRLLQEWAQRDYPALQEELLRCLSSPVHRSGCRVHFCVARRL